MRDEDVLFIRNSIDIANNWFDDQSLGVLFNGYNEPGDGDFHSTLFSPHNIQVDSGGLQMITLGHTPTEKLKDAVYKVQAKYGTIGMCFDEIPIKVTGKSQAVDVTSGNRKFDRSMIPECARQTAENIVRQIDVFDQESSSCKPLLIVQGNGIDSYQEWADKILEKIPQDYQQKLAGIASGGACIGDGELEDLERFFALSVLEIPENLKQQFHLLGVGSPNRIQTLTKLKHNFKDLQHISYDSTKHTGGIVRSQVQVKSSIITIGRHKTPVYWRIWDLFNRFQKEKLSANFSEEEFHDSILLSMGDLIEKHGDIRDDIAFIGRMSILRFSVLLFSVYNNFELLSLALKDNNYVSKSKKRVSHIYRTLEHVKTKDDFEKWKSEYGRYLDSNKTPSVDDIVSDLSDFFK